MSEYEASAADPDITAWTIARVRTAAEGGNRGMPGDVFTGRHTLDDRGRVAVPVRFRAWLAQGATLALDTSAQSTLSVAFFTSIGMGA